MKASHPVLRLASKPAAFWRNLCPALFWRDLTHRRSFPIPCGLGCLAWIAAACLLSFPVSAPAQVVFGTPYEFTTVAGFAGAPGVFDGTGQHSRFNLPSSIVVDSAGTLYVADFGSNTIRVVTSLVPNDTVPLLDFQGVVTTLAGQSAPGSADGAGTNAQFRGPAGVALDGAGNIYVSDAGNNAIRMVTPAGAVTTIAGLAGTRGSADGTGADAQFDFPHGVAVDSATNIYVADTDNCTIRKIAPGGVVTTLAGKAGQVGSSDATGSAASFSYPYGVALDGAGNLYVTDTGNNTIRMITPAGVVTTLAGFPGTSGFVDGTGNAALFGHPWGLTVDSANNIYVADTDNCTIRLVTAAGKVTTVAGSPTNAGIANGIDYIAHFDHPRGIAVDSASGIYLADTLASTIRKGVPYPLVDKTRPAINIVFPASGGTEVSNAIVIEGVARDNVEVASVYVQLNGQGWVLADSTNIWYTWSATFPANPGLNTVSAYAVDTSGNVSATQTVNFHFITSGPLVVQTNGNGYVTPNYNGKFLVLGRTYGVTAVPLAGWVFSDWLGGTATPYSVLSTSRAYQFSMQQNLVLIAEFAPKQAAEALETYNGLFLNTNDLAGDRVGFVTMTLAESGAFTGKILTPDGAYTLPASKFADGNAKFALPVNGNTLDFDLQLNRENPAAPQITGVVSGGQWTAPFAASHGVPGQNANAGRGYSVTIAETSNPATDRLGKGRATFTITPKGIITMTGHLPDETAISQSASVTQDGRWPFYASCDPSSPDSPGAIVGWLTFANGSPASPAGNLYWFRPGSKTPTAVSVSATPADGRASLPTSPN